MMLRGGQMILACQPSLISAGCALMAIFQFRTATEQVADYLRGELSRRRWSGQLPGSNALAKELGVGKSSIEAALLLLEEEGLLIPQGTGRPRRIELRKGPSGSARRVQILLRGKCDRTRDLMIELVQQLQLAGHAAVFSAKTLDDMKMDVKKVSRFVRETEADDWVVLGANREILEWFASQSQPAYALFGRQSSVNIAGTATLKSPALARAVQRLVELGHRRIVMLSRPDRLKPKPGLFEQRFLDTLAQYGIHTGSFNLPDWEDDPADFRHCLDSLFAHTPPTALIFDQSHLFFAAQQHLALRGLAAPQDLSMLCNDPDPVFRWSEPAVSHLRWDSRRLIKNVVRWVNHLGHGRDNRRQSLIEAEFVEGGTIGPLPRVSRDALNRAYPATAEQRDGHSF